ncbi:hypothetical protein G9P44_004851 [Scheffersomyces stipitis]|nr:hypothetical protein G9P44_004851 [Scheffersomyces stipitis]
MSLLETLSSEIGTFTKSGGDNLHDLYNESESLLKELKELEASLESQLEQENISEARDENIDDDEKMDEDIPKENLNLGECLSKFTNKWYKTSIDSLKSYNTATNRFSKNILVNSKFNIDLDDAYTYPLLLNNFPVYTDSTEKDKTESVGFSSDLKGIKIENREELIKAIILHLLKIGQCDIVKEIVKELSLGSSVVIDESLLAKFEFLNKIVQDIVVNHDLSKALSWFKDKYNEKVRNSSRISQLSNPVPSNFNDIEFKFHMLEFIILLNGKDSSFSLNDALDAYLYSKDNFSRFFKEYLSEISPLMTLLLFQNNRSEDDFDLGNHKDKLLADFIAKMKHSFNIERDRKKNNASEMRFVSELLDHFENIHSQQSLFVNISNEFISEYCKDLRLSNDSSLFQSILAGYIYLPSFYKYNQIQSKMNKLISVSSEARNGDDSKNGTSTEMSNGGEATIINYEATFNYDLPFQLPDSNRFLFNYHPIFICPISKEQLVPITHNQDQNVDEEPQSKRKKSSSLDPAASSSSTTTSFSTSSSSPNNPVVVLNFCQHLALRESVWQLSKKGSDIFKCHYCYKKHKFSDVTDAYFIDL